MSNSQYPYGQYPYGNNTPGGQSPGGQNGYPYGNGTSGGQNSGGQNGYPYGNGAPPQQDPYVLRQRLEEKRRIRIFSCGAAIATGAFLLLASLIYLPYMRIVGQNVLNPSTETQLVMNISVDLLITLVSLFFPFFLVNLLYKKTLNVEPIPCGKASTGALDTLLFIAGGFGAMMIADYVSGTISSFIQDAADTEFAYSFFSTPTSAVGIIVYVIRSTLFPAIVEEYAMRGVVMNSLRRYGDTFAITMSAMMFGLMHGNLVQIPFAFLAGLVLGYVVIKTGTLWTGIAIHFLNNSLSIIYTLLYDNGFEKSAELVSVLATAIGAGIGVVCLIILILRKKVTKPAPNRSFLSTKSCYGTFFLTPPMILVLIYMVVQTILVQKTGLG